MKKSRRMRWAARTMALCMMGSLAFAGTVAVSPVTAAADSIIDGQTVSGTITINKKAENEQTPLQGAEFAIYKVMSLTPGETAGEYAEYEPTADFADELRGVSADALGNYSAQALEGLIGNLVTASETAEAVDTKTTNASGQAVFSNLELGYYLVVETEAPADYVKGSPFLIAVPSTNNYDGEGDGTSWVYSVTAEPKNAKISIDKTLADPEKGAEQDGTVAVGDFVKYEVTTVIPNYPAEYFENDVTFTITDVMSDGLEIQDDAAHPVKVTVDGSPVEEGAGTYSLTAADQTGAAADLTVSFAKTYIQNNANKEVVITYYAEVTQEAVTGTSGNSNEVTLTYNNGPDSETTAAPPEVHVYSFNIQIEKFTKEAGMSSGSPLQGAEFELYADADLTEQIGQTSTTTAQGLINFELLDAGTYYLKETKAPAGYTLLADPIKVEIIAGDAGAFTLKVNDQEINATSGTYVSRIDAAGGTAIIAVENHKGFTLPATGGMGIALFVIIGIAGITAVSIVITKKTKKN